MDAIATTGPPHSMHLIGLGLKRRLNIPWLADFRDPWTEIDYHEDLMLTRRAEKKHRRLEKTVLDEADRILVVSPSMQEALAAQTKTPVDLLTNGYDEDDFEGNVVQPDKTFTISYTGNFVRSQNPVILWKALSDILKEDPSFGKHLKIHLIGKMDFAIKGSLIAHGLMPYVEETGYVSHNCAITYQKRSQILLVILKQVPIAGRFLPGKFFEYLAAHRPILCVGPPESDTGKILRACNAGTIVDYDDYESTKTAIIHFYSHYKKGQLTSYNKGIEYYSRKKLTGRLSEIMYSMT